MRNRLIAMPLAFCAAMSIGGCGGSSNSSAPSPPPVTPPNSPPPATTDPEYRVSGTSPFTSACDTGTIGGVVFANAELEPSFAIDPTRPSVMAAVWQQDRWSTGGARGIVAGNSSDGGHTWSQRAMPFSRCGGGTSANGGDYERASNPWITVAPDGTFHQLSLAFSGSVLAAGSTSAMVVSRSADGGVTWQPTQTLIRDVDNFFNDKGAITANPSNANVVYAVWDRLTSAGTGPTEFTRSLNGGASWESVRPIYDPGTNNQTISNVIVVLPNGILLDLLVDIRGTSNNAFTSAISVIRSMDNGVTWSSPIKIADNLSVGTVDPENGRRVRDSALIPEIAVAPNGRVFTVWQDARFSGGARDGIALSHSDDAGVTWSGPVQINRAPTVAAFSPKAKVRADGEIGVSYYDFRDDTGNAAVLSTVAWLVKSSDGVAWSERQISPVFDLALAPLTTSPAPGGYFIGDYQALESVGSVFMPMFTQTVTATSDPTDIFLAPAVSGTSTATAKTFALQSYSDTESFRQRVSDNIRQALQSRPAGRIIPPTN